MLHSKNLSIVRYPVVLTDLIGHQAQLLPPATQQSKLSRKMQRIKVKRLGIARAL